MTPSDSKLADLVCIWNDLRDTCGERALEFDVLLLLAQGLRDGAETYGPLHQGDCRNMKREAADEARDWLVYRAFDQVLYRQLDREQPHPSRWRRFWGWVGRWW